MKTTLWQQVTWPYDTEAAKTITCYSKRMRVAADVPSRFAARTVYVWRNEDNANWSYTVQGELTGLTTTSDLQQAFRQAEERSQR